MKRIPCVILAIMVLGCAKTYNAPDPLLRHYVEMDMWIHHHVSKAIRFWGPPTQKTDDGVGGSIYIWRYEPTQVTRSSSVHLPLFNQSFYNTIQYAQSLTVMLYVLPSGKIYDWNSNLRQF